MTERFSSTRKHKKHKANHKTITTNNSTISSHESNLNNESVDDSNGLTANEYQSSVSGSTSSTSMSVNNFVTPISGANNTPNKQPLRLVLKVAQSGAYSPAQATCSGDHESTNNDSMVGNNQPPQLLPLNVDSFQSAHIYTTANGTFKRSKKKKKKHHHHHHHHHHHQHHHSSSSSSVKVNSQQDGTTSLEVEQVNHMPTSFQFDTNGTVSPSSVVKDVKQQTSSVTTVPMDEEANMVPVIDLDLDARSTASGSGTSSNAASNCYRPANKTIMNLIESELANSRDSINSVDLIDVDSCNLDISCLQPTGSAGASPPDDDDEHEDAAVDIPIATTSNNNNHNQLKNSFENVNDDQIVDEMNDGTTRRKNHRGDRINRQWTSTTIADQNGARLKQSLYRRMLQSGHLRCDSNNILTQIHLSNGAHAKQAKLDAILVHGSMSKARAFKRCLKSLLDQLREKDPNNYFAWPVTDLIKPGYSCAIDNPMDFSTIAKKIQFNLYRSVYEMKLDVRILCENALKYYRQSGSQYRDAARLWYHAKTKIFTRDTFAELVKQFPPLTVDDLGLEQLLPLPVSNTNGLTKVSCNLFNEENEDDDDEDDDIGADEKEKPTSEQMLKEAYKNLGQDQSSCDDQGKSQLPTLSLTKPRTQLVRMLRQRMDGSTSLSFVNPIMVADNGSEPEHYTIGSIIGRLTEGSATLNTSYKEPEMNRVKVMQFVNDAYSNPYSSHLPAFDAKGYGQCLDLADSSFVLGTFDKCEEFHRESIQKVIDSGDDYLVDYVDSVLSIITSGEYVKDHRNLEETSNSEGISNVDTSEITTENKENSDLVADKTTIVKDELVDEDDPIQSKLDETKSLIDKLKSAQYRRLTNGTVPKQPDEDESKLAEKVTSKLVDIISHCARPRDVISVQTIHKAMGITVDGSDDLDGVIESETRILEEQEPPSSTLLMDDEVQPMESVQLETVLVDNSKNQIISNEVMITSSADVSSLQEEQQLPMETSLNGLEETAIETTTTNAEQPMMVEEVTIVQQQTGTTSTSSQQQTMMVPI